MKEALKTAMTTSISEVLETMFFMTIETFDGTDWEKFTEESADETLFVSKINFNGPLSGYFVLMIPENVLSAMTEMFMGLEADGVTDTHLLGTISEAINMIAGNTFSRLDDQAVYNLEIPELVDVGSLLKHSAHPDKNNIFIRIKTPGGHLGLQLSYFI